MKKVREEGFQMLDGDPIVPQTADFSRSTISQGQIPISL